MGNFQGAQGPPGEPGEPGEQGPPGESAQLDCSGIQCKASGCIGTRMTIDDECCACPDDNSELNGACTQMAQVCYYKAKQTETDDDGNEKVTVEETRQPFDNYCKFQRYFDSDDQKDKKPSLSDVYGYECARVGEKEPGKPDDMYREAKRICQLIDSGLYKPPSEKCRFLDEKVKRGFNLTWMEREAHTHCAPNTEKLSLLSQKCGDIKCLPSDGKEPEEKSECSNVYDDVYDKYKTLTR